MVSLVVTTDDHAFANFIDTAACSLHMDSMWESDNTGAKLVDKSPYNRKSLNKDLCGSVERYCFNEKNVLINL